jgi:flagellar biosynthesis/type III secretory pathway protein FliH
MAKKSNILTEEQARPLQGVVKPFHIQDVMSEARDALADARVKAESLIQEAQEQAEAIRQTAWDDGCQRGKLEGWEAGREAGHDEAFKQASERFEQEQGRLVSLCRQAIDSIDAHRAEWEASARHDLIELAMAIATRVVRHVGEHDRNVVLANLEEAIRISGERSAVTIQINPHDAETAQSFAKQLIDAKGACKHVDIVEMEDIAPGGCKMLWGSGAVDARLETQLDRISQALGLAAQEAAQQEDDSKDESDT